MNSTTSLPLCVDVDGTLIRSDLLLESVFALLKHNIFYIFLLPIWLLKGKANLKHQIASRVEIDAGLLPYHEEFLTFLRQQHVEDRRIVLATASNKIFAQAIALNLGLFTDVLASDAHINLSGPRKLKRLLDLFGPGGFDYAGNAVVDLPLLREANKGILVNPERGVKKAAESQSAIDKIFDDRQGSPFRHYLKALRLHQWLKNLLIFVPLVMAHKFNNLFLIEQSIIAFIAFGLCASSVYLLNDLIDLPEDRQHPKKKYRPFAAGTVPIINGVLLIPGLLVAAFGLSLLLPIEFIGVLVFYYVITLAYSFRLKRAILVDVLTLAGLYTIRIIAGAAAITVEPSFWLLAFSMFFFLSLALVKRYTELLALVKNDKNESPGRGYRTDELGLLAQFGIASAFTAILVLALYINSGVVQALYSQPKMIWLLCPVLLYLITRIWMLSHRNELQEDPVVFIIRDRRSQLLILIGAVILWLAI